MAERRMLARKVAISKKISKVSWQAEAIYYRCIPFADDGGVLPAEPEELRTLICPRGKKGKQLPLAVVESIIEELHGIGLIELFSENGDTYLHIWNFDKFQTFKNDRPLTYEYPRWNPKESKGIQENPKDSSRTRALREVKRSKDKRSKDEVPKKSSHECGKPEDTNIPAFLQKSAAEEILDESPTEIEARKQKYLKDYREGKV